MKISLTVPLLLAAWITDCDSLLRSFAVVRPTGNSHHRSRSFDRIARSDPRNHDRTTIRSSIEKETSLEARRSGGDDDDDDDESTLTLRGDFSFASADLPVEASNGNGGIDDFFRRKDTRDLLVTGGGERPCVETKPTPSQLKDWKKRCASLGAVGEPDENDPVLSVVSRGIQFPGLKVESNALIGAKYVAATSTTTKNTNTKNTNPRYEFVLLSTKQIASGLPPAVWVYRKLTGSDDENSTFDSLSTCTYEERENNNDNNDGTVAFRTDAFLSIVVKFPRFLTRILPVDKTTMEERGGKSIAKTLDKDIMQSMKSLEKAYLESFDFAS